MNEPRILYTGVVVEVIDGGHPMCGWRGIVTSPRMWARPIYRKIPDDNYRVEMDSGEGKFYGDYHRDQLKVIRLPDDRRVRPK